MDSNRISRMRTRVRSMPAATIMIIAVCATVAFSAQQPSKTNQPAQPPPKDQFEFMSRELSLTPEQKPKVQAIVDAQKGEWDTLEKNKTLNGKQKIARMQEINATAQAKIDKILTAEQRKKLSAIMDASKPKPGKLAPNRKPKAPAGSPEP